MEKQENKFVPFTWKMKRSVLFWRESYKDEGRTIVCGRFNVNHWQDIREAKGLPRIEAQIHFSCHT